MGSKLTNSAINYLQKKHDQTLSPATRKVIADQIEELKRQQRVADLADAELDKRRK